MDSRERRVGENEVLFRQVNQGIRDVANAFGVERERERFVCECGDPGCDARIELTREEYRDVRDADDTFVVVDGHHDESVEHVVGHVREYAVIRKDDGGPAELARDYPS
jgi:hypothetical protein